MSIKDIDKGWKRINKQMKLMDDSFVNVGVLSDAGTYDSENGRANLVDVASFNEFGTESIPERPFMRQTFDTKNKEVSRKFNGFKKKIFQGIETVRGALDKMGTFYKGEVQKTIGSGDFAPNVAATIAKKGSSKPLIDTGRLRQSVDYEVTMK